MNIKKYKGCKIVKDMFKNTALHSRVKILTFAALNSTV
jgi:hypothetical protein